MNAPSDEMLPSSSLGAVTEDDFERTVSSMQDRLDAMRSMIYELQEVRHKAVAALPGPASSLSPLSPPLSPRPVVDEILISLNEKLEAISSEYIPLLETQSQRLLEDGTLGERPEWLSRYEDLLDDWRDVSDDVDNVKEELKEDRWLSIFRTAAGQAEPMMESLEKVLAQCHDLIHQVRRLQSGQPPGDEEVTLSSFESLLQNYEAKKKHYKPSVEKVLSVLDKGVRERVTKNGETLRRHSEMLSRWRTLTARLAKIEADLTSAHLWLVKRGSSPSPHRLAFSQQQQTQQQLSSPPTSRPPVSSRRSPLPSSSSYTSSLASPPPSETGSSASIQTPPLERVRKTSVASAVARSMSPLQSVFGKLSIRNGPRPSRGDSSPPQPPLSSTKKVMPGSTARTTPPRKTTSERHPRPNFSEERVRAPPMMHIARPRWNSSSRVPDLAPIPHQPSEVQTPPPLSRRTSLSTMRRSGGAGSSAGGPVSTTGDGSSSRAGSPVAALPPSRIPTQTSVPRHRATSLPQHLSADGSAQRSAGAPAIPPRDPRRASHGKSTSSSQIPVPTFSLHPASEPSDSPLLLSGAFSASRATTPSPPPRLLDRSQTPIAQIRQNAARTAFYTPARTSAGSSTSPSSNLSPAAHLKRPSPSPSSAYGKTPPSSFRDLPPSFATPPRPSSRASSSGAFSSRAGAATPSSEPWQPYRPHPANTLDVEIARIVNCSPGIHVSRVDPLPRNAAQAKADTAATYTFSSAMTRKTLSCRVLELSKGRTSNPIKSLKVMVRVGGGWLDLEVHLLKMGF